MQTCPECSAPVIQPRTGRRRTYCSRLCRSRADHRAERSRAVAHNQAYWAGVADGTVELPDGFDEGFRDLLRAGLLGPV